MESDGMAPNLNPMGLNDFKPENYQQPNVTVHYDWQHNKNVLKWPPHSENMRELSKIFLEAAAKTEEHAKQTTNEEETAKLTNDAQKLREAAAFLRTMVGE
jgi:hypothetical protein